MAPETRALFEEVAARPGSMLLSATRAQMMKELRDPPTRVGSATPFLSTAERQLIEVHREEVATYLYRWAAFEISHIEELGLTDYQPINRWTGQPACIPSKRDLIQLRKAGLHECPETIDGLHALRESKANASVKEIQRSVTIAHRLWPIASAQSLQALIHLGNGEMPMAEVSARIAASRSSTSVELACTESILACVAFRRSEFATAAELYLRSITRQPRDRHTYTTLVAALASRNKRLERAALEYATDFPTSTLSIAVAAEGDQRWLQLAGPDSMQGATQLLRQIA